MSGDLDLYGLFLPELLVCAVLALVAQTVLSRALVRVGAYRWVWHPPLVDVALFAILLGGFTFLMHRM